MIAMIPNWSSSDVQAASGALDKWSSAFGVPRDLAYAIAAQESQFKPTAYRYEPALNDASYGIMQVLYATAIGMGYTGAPAGLFDTDTSARLGLTYLVGLYRRFGDWTLAVSAYNGGYRNGAITNPSYVNNVTDKAAYFAAQFAPPIVYQSPGDNSVATDQAAAFPWWIAVALIGGIIMSTFWRKG